MLCYVLNYVATVGYKETKSCWHVIGVSLSEVVICPAWNVVWPWERCQSRLTGLAPLAKIKSDPLKILDIEALKLVEDGKTPPYVII